MINTHNHTNKNNIINILHIILPDGTAKKSYKIAMHVGNYAG